MNTINTFLDRHPAVCVFLVLACIAIVGAIERADMVAQGIAK